MTLYGIHTSIAKYWVFERLTGVVFFCLSNDLKKNSVSVILACIYCIQNVMPKSTSKGTRVSYFNMFKSNWQL